MKHVLAGLPNSHSSIVAAIEDRGSYSSTHPLWRAVYDKIFKFTERSADRISSSAVPGVCPSTDRRSTHFLLEFGWEMFNYHVHCNPDLAPSDFHLFLQLKKFLFSQRQRFQNDRVAEMSVTMVPITGGILLRHRIQKFVPWHDKCLSSGSEYVEKFFNGCCICSSNSFH